MAAFVDVIFFRLDVGVAVFIQLFGQLVGAHPARIQGVAKPVLIKYGQLHGNYRVSCHCTGGFCRISFAVPFSFLIHFRKGEVLRAVQFREETCFVITEFRIGKLAYISGTRLGKYGINGK